MSTRQVRRVTRFVSQQIWAIREATLDVIVEVLRMRAAGIELSKEEVQARIGASSPPSVRQQGAVAILPLYGVISPKINAMTEISGGTSLDRWMAQFRQARDEAEVSAIVVDVDSPGGSAFGVPEVADEIFKSRNVKPIIAVVSPECGSAALWIACACGEIVCTPSGSVGSLGVFCCHEDWSKANEMMGVKPTYISAGPYKVEGNQDNPLSDEALAFFQSQVDSIYDTFVRSVARGRGVSPTKAKSDFGQGRMMLAKDALRAGLVDRIDTLDNVIARLVGKRSSAGRTAAGLANAVAMTEQIAGDVAELKANLDEGAAQIEALSAAAKSEADEIVEPDENGECPEGYEKQDDGMCHVKPAEQEKAATEVTAEAASPDVVVIGPDGRVITGDDKKAILEVLPSMDALRRDKDWLETV